MKKYVVLLRGINVGGNNIVPMRELKPLLVKAGYRDVSTYIQSGNILLLADTDPAEDIAYLIQEHFGFRPAALSLTKEAFVETSANNPYVGADGKTVHFYFCDDAPKPNMDRTTSLKAETEDLKIIAKVAFLRAPNGIGRSKLAANLERCLEVPVTARNLNTVNKLLGLLAV